MNLARCAEIESALKNLLVYNTYIESPLCASKPEIAAHLANEDYIDVLRLGNELLWSNLKVDLNSLPNISAILKDLLQGSSIERFSDVIALGVAYLQLFVEINFAGRSPLNWTLCVELAPPLSVVNANHEDEEKVRKSFLDHVRNELVLDGEYLVGACRNPELLFMASCLLRSTHGIVNSVANSFTHLWWKFRYWMVHQKVLEEKSEMIHRKIQNVVVDIDSVLSEDDKKSFHYIHFLTELAAFHQQYFDVAKTKQCLETACRLVGLDLQLTGALGRRTKFQEHDLAQLTLNVEKSVDVSVEEVSQLSTIEDDLPNDVRLDDEIRLERIEFKDEERRKIPALTLTEQTLILSQFFLAKRSQPRDALTQEQLMPYLENVLRQNVHKSWSLKMVALMQRSLLEKDSSRTVERSLFQLETMVENLNHPSEWKSKKHRMRNIYGSNWIPFWVLESELVRLLISLGSVKSALDRALKIQLWDDVIECYTFLNLKHKAAEIILQQIEQKGESAHLYCLLGDATENIDHYKKALEVSNNRSSRAYRSLGAYHYFRKEYSEAIEYFQKSLALNTFQLQTLLRLGYSAIQIEAWDIAATTYWKYCSYETDNFEAWNNLSNAYIKLGQKSRAWKVLQEAVKCDYDNWKIWDNVMVVSTDCAEFEEVIRSYHRILDLKEGKHLDLDVLKILVNAISTNILDNSGRNSFRFKGGAQKLFGRLTLHFVADPEVWRLYAKLITSSEASTSVDAEAAFKAGQMMQKSVGSAVQVKDWTKHKEACIKTLELGSEAVQYCLNASNFPENKAQSVSQLASLKMTLNSIVAKVKATQMSMTSDEVSDEVKPAFRQLQNDIQQVVQRIATLKL